MIQENQNFAKNLSIASCDFSYRSKEKMIVVKLLNKLITLTSNQIQTLTNNEAIIETIANEMMLLRRNVWINNEVQKRLG